MKIIKEQVPVRLIDNEEQLHVLVSELHQKKEIAFDTEFDSFNKQYGIHLQLIQIFDGETCYLVDPLKIKDLTSLWNIFADESTSKIVYSGSNDIDILKRNGCFPKNLYDLQLATELCQLTARSLGAALLEYFNIEVDKSAQAAGWANRPLSKTQLNYAAEDVIYLFELKKILCPIIEENKIEETLKEKNKALEFASSKDYAPRLSDKQKKIFNKYSGQKLLELKILIDKYAQLLNLPPFKIIRDSALEEMVTNPQKFLNSTTGLKLFHRELISNKNFQNELFTLLQSINTGLVEVKPKFIT